MIYDLFPTEILPDMRKYHGLMKGIKTPVCGHKKGCEVHQAGCNEYCAKQVSVSELNGKDIVL